MTTIILGGSSVPLWGVAALSGLSCPPPVAPDSTPSQSSGSEDKLAVAIEESRFFCESYN